MGRAFRFLRYPFLFFFLLSSISFVSPAQYFNESLPKKRIALTFDDGPRPASTLRLRQMLKMHNVKATFFIVGEVASVYPREVQSLAKEGHEIANHSWSHPDIGKITEEELQEEFDSTRELIRDLTGINTSLLRTPGSTRHYLINLFHVPVDYTLVLWDVHSLDHEGISAEEIADRIVTEATDGDIVILHNGLKTTVAALDCLIPELKSNGFEFVTVSSILKYRQKSNISSLFSSVVRG